MMTRITVAYDEYAEEIFSSVITNPNKIKYGSLIISRGQKVMTMQGYKLQKISVKYMHRNVN